MIRCRSLHTPTHQIRYARRKNILRVDCHTHAHTWPGKLEAPVVHMYGHVNCQRSHRCARVMNFQYHRLKRHNIPTSASLGGDGTYSNAGRPRRDRKCTHLCRTLFAPANELTVNTFHVRANELRPQTHLRLHTHTLILRLYSLSHAVSVCAS